MMTHLKPKAILIALACCLTACTAATPQPAQQTSSPNQQQRRATPTPLSTRAVEVVSVVAVDGQLALATPAISVGFDVSAAVVSVTVKLGQAVKKGDVLATVDDLALQDAVVDAQLALKLAQANIGLQNIPSNQQDIDAAQAALNAAYSSYNVTKAGITQAKIDAGKQSVDSAWQGYLSVQISRDIACGSKEGLKAAGCKSAEASYGNAFESWLSAKDSYQKLLEPVAQSALIQGYSAVSSAQAKLDTLKTGVTADQAKIDAAQIAQAQATLDTAKASLDKAKLVSPCDCIVQEIDAVPGVVAPATAFILVDLSHLQFKTTNLTERDVAKIKIGAAVSIRLKAYEQLFKGKVAALLPQSSGASNGQAYYTVLIDLDPTPQQLLPGMNGQASITNQ